MTIMAIDPGPTESAYVIIEPDTCRPVSFGKVANGDLMALLCRLSRDQRAPSRLTIEMVAAYGMSVGAEVFETCVWIGRFLQAAEHWTHVDRKVRLAVKLHHCHNAAAKDSNIVQALRDRFAPGEPNYGKGTKDAPGWFHGFAADVWQAYALAVLTADGAQ